VIPYAQAKLARKGCDLIVANDVSRSDSTFGSDTSRIAFVSAGGVEELDTLPKSQVAEKIIDRLVALLEAHA
jgi:phosphopantothenoylcysteine decarboxylase/phosphopantothenate--cysteine ligase